MPTIADIRADYPQYSDMSDADLASALHRKFYSDMPFAEFSAKVGLGAGQSAQTPGVPRITVTPRGSAAPGSDMGGYSPQQIPPSPQEDIGRVNAGLRGAYQGITANFGDELAGLNAAAGSFLGGGTAAGPLGTFVGPLVGGARLAYEGLTGNPGEATKAYEGARNAVRSDLAQAEAQYPGTTLAGNVAGAVAIPMGGMLNGATLLARMARGAGVGAGFGALSGVGEGTTTEDRITRGVSGAILGGGAGALAPPVLAGLGAATSAVASPITSAVRGMINPEREAARRVVGSITNDMRNGTAGLTPAEFMNAQRGGAPVSVLDLGGDTTRRLARSASNTSTEGGAALQNLADARFEGQSDRASQFIRNLVGPVDTQATRDTLRTAAHNVNRPAYQRAYMAPNAQVMWDDGFQQLMQAPVVQEAARKVTRTGANEAAMQGYTPVRNPFAWDEQGRWTLRTDGRPNLQFWDHVQRNLRDAYDTAVRQGANNEARQITALRSELLSRLDQTVPEFQAARAGAARFFGAEDALSAGENFVRSNMTAREGARAIAQMSPQERELFRQGFSARLIDDINNTRDRVNVLNKIGQSPEARNKLQVALGPQGYRNIEGFLTVEHAMDRFRGALGNSTTARQLVELGLAGGAGYGLSGGDLTTGGAAALAAFLVRKGGVRIDERVARRVAEMLTSNDPQVLAQGVRTAMNNRAIMNALRNLDSGRIAGQQGTTAIPSMQAGGIGRAEDQQQ